MDEVNVWLSIDERLRASFHAAERWNDVGWFEGNDGNDDWMELLVASSPAGTSSSFPHYITWRKKKQNESPPSGFVERVYDLPDPLGGWRSNIVSQ